MTTPKVNAYRDPDTIRSHHSQASIESRRQSHPRPRHPDELHDYVPDRRIDHDECSVCGRLWENAIHIPIGPEDPGDV